MDKKDPHTSLLEVLELIRSFPPPPPIEERIAMALERIAGSLESIVRIENSRPPFLKRPVP